LAFDFSYWLFQGTITTLAAAEATLQGVNGYTRLTPTNPPANTQISLYVRARPLQTPEWMQLVSNNFSQATLNQALQAHGFQGYVGNQPQVAGLVMVMIIEVNNRVFAVTAGTGIGLLDRDVMVAYAGKDAYLNQADDGDLSEVSAGSGGRGGKTVTVKSNSKSTTDQFPKGDGLRVVKKLGGETTMGGQKIGASCGHQFRTEGSVNLSDVVQRCIDFLAAQGNRAQRKPELAVLAPTEPVKGDGPILQLDTQLHQQLVGNAILDVSFMPPSVDFSGPYTYQLTHQASKGSRVIQAGALVNWDEVSMRNIIRNALTTPWHLRAAKIEIIGPTRSQEVPFIRCISFQGLPSATSRMILDDGVWHEVQLSYIQELDRDIGIMFGRWQPPIALPNRSLANHATEEDYNRAVAAQLGFTFLDKAAARPQFHGSPLELCDMFAPDGTLYLVKVGVQASKAVYVADQGLSALSALSLSGTYWNHYTTTQGVVYGHDPRNEPHKFRWVITLISDNVALLPTQLKYKAKRALVAFDSKARSEWKFETGLVHVLEVP
jgi:uncharacterized protein (TIGR04141 family)